MLHLFVEFRKIIFFINIRYSKSVWWRVLAIRSMPVCGKPEFSAFFCMKAFVIFHREWYPCRNCLVWPSVWCCLRIWHWCCQWFSSIYFFWYNCFLQKGPTAVLVHWWCPIIWFRLVCIDSQDDILVPTVVTRLVR